jgi:diguanylate cyclase (GGDEF)-like protein
VLSVVAGLLGVVVIAVLDYATGPDISCSIFYLLPVALAAWYGGTPHGILLALGGSVAWHAVDMVENPTIPAAAAAWNGVVRFGTLVLVASLVSRLHAGVRRERRLARTDPLTGAANARTFYETAVTDAERARKAGRPLTLAYFDVDNFKQLNDHHGHAAGDEALIVVVRTVHNLLGTAGLLARLGGDEFALLLPGQGAEEAVALLGRVQAVLTEEARRRGWPVTLSIGAVTFLRPAWELDVMIRRVDALMYAAKRKGKGRVEHAVVAEEAAPRVCDRRQHERRATARILCSQSARVREAGQEGAPEEFTTLRDLSAGGVGMALGKPLPCDTLVVVEPLIPGARALLARVVRVAEEGGSWVHGCVLSPRLSAEELAGWLQADGDLAPPADAAGEGAVGRG